LELKSRTTRKRVKNDYGLHNLIFNCRRKCNRKKLRKKIQA
jgi:hypothetical protein